MIAAVAGLPLIVILALGLARLPVSQSLPPEPKPNGYELLLSIARAFQADDPRNVTNEIAAYLDAHKEHYANVEQVLPNDWEAPARAYDAKSSSSMDYIAFRKVDAALLLKARHLDAQGRWDDAARVTADVIRLGQKMEHGPLISMMVGSAVQLSGATQLQKRIPKLSSRALAELASEVLDLSSSRISFEEVLRRERFFMRRNAANLFQYFRERFSSNSRGTVKNSRERWMNTAAALEITAALMGIRRHQLEAGEPPGTLRELVPGHLPRMPADPFTREALLFRSEAGSFLVYSAGLNRRDEGGKGDDITAESEDTTGYKALIQSLQQIAGE